MDRPTILDTAKSHVTQDRQAAHGKPENSFQLIADFWTVYLKGRGLFVGSKVGATEFATLQVTAVDVAQMMALLKTARAVLNPTNEDNWVDHAGYVACGGELATLQAGGGPWVVDPVSEKPTLAEIMPLAQALKADFGGTLTPHEHQAVQNVLLNATVTENDLRFVRTLHQKKYNQKS